MMTEKDIETARFMATVWKLNDERNQRIESEKKLLAKIRKHFEEDK